MKKNTASQVIGAQLVSKTDGSAVTSGTTTVYVTGDGGTQATGSVSSGAATHEGNGFWTYAPAQAETNYDHVAFTFVNSSACNVTVQVYTSFPQTGDSFSRIGSTGSGLTSLASQSSLDTLDDYVDTEIAAIKAKTDGLTFTVSGKVDANVTDWKGATAPAMSGDAYARLGAPAGASVSADIAAVKTDTAAILDDTGTSGVVVAAGSKTGYALTAAYDQAKTAAQAGDAMALTSGERTTLTGTILTTQITESYRANGAAPTLAQAQCEMLAHMGEASNSGTTKTLKKFDHSATAATYTYDDATAPTSVTRTT